MRLQTTAVLIVCMDIINIEIIQRKKNTYFEHQLLSLFTKQYDPPVTIAHLMATTTGSTRRHAVTNILRKAMQFQYNGFQCYRLTHAKIIAIASGGETPSINTPSMAKVAHIMATFLLNYSELMEPTHTRTHAFQTPLPVNSLVPAPWNDICYVADGEANGDIEIYFLQGGYLFAEMTFLQNSSRLAQILCSYCTRHSAAPQCSNCTKLYNHTSNRCSILLQFLHHSSEKTINSFLRYLLF